MPVLVTCADSQLGSALVHRLLATGGQVRAWCSGGGGGGSLRQAGAIVATGDLDDTGRLEAACEQVHTVVHVGGGLLSTSPERIVSDTASVVEAASGAGVRRLVLLSVVGAGASAGDDLRRAKWACEGLVEAADVPSVALRVPLVLDGDLRDLLAGTPLPDHVRPHPVRTVSAPALVELLWMLDEMRSQATRGHATLVAQGSPPRPLGEVAAHLDVDRPAYRSLDELPLLLPGLLGPWTEAASTVADAWALTGVDPAGALA